MGHHALFYDSQNNDRVYDADSFESLFQAFFNTGVSRNGGGMAVTGTGGMAVEIAPGLVNIDGKVGVFGESQTLSLAAASAAETRYDLVVVRRDDTERDITTMILAGTPGGGVPQKGAGDVLLATLTIAPGATEPTIAQNEDAYITQAVPTDTLEAYGQQFEEWFSALQTTLSGDTAALLAGQISAVQSELDAVRTTANQAQSAASAAQNLATNASSLKIRQIAAYTWLTADDAQSPGVLVTANDLQTLDATGEHDMLLVLFRRDYKADSPTVWALVRKGGVAQAFDYAEGKLYTRTIRWNTANYTVTFRTQKLAKKNRSAQETFDPGLFISWAQTGASVKNRGDLYEHWTAATSGLSAAKATTQNGANAGNNKKFNAYLLPVAVYAVTGATGA